MLMEFIAFIIKVPVPIALLFITVMVLIPLLGEWIMVRDITRND